MKKQLIVALALCTLQTMQSGAAPMQMTNTVIAATAPVPVQQSNPPQPLQISEMHIAGHPQPSSGQPVMGMPQPSMNTTKPVAPVTVPVTSQTSQTNSTPMAIQPVQAAPVTLTPNTPGTVSPTEIKKQLQDLQDHITQVSQQLDMVTTTK